jgi:hypothetical protein
MPCRCKPSIVLAAALLATCFARAQTAPSVRAKVPVDPYTQEEPELLQKAGYVSFGPFPFAGSHTTLEVAELLGTEPIAWIETAHFRIGCALPTLPLKTDADWRDDWVQRLKPELKRLAAKLPRVKPDTRQLDPWLRAHLTAQRLEELYAEVLANLDARDDSFPQEPDGVGDASSFRGLGPYLGMRGKFTVLLVRKASSHARYTRAYQQNEISDPIRYHDGTSGSMYWGASEETAEGLFRADYALHSHLVFNVAHNLYTGYRSFGHDLPPWFVTGLAHWHSRRVSPRFPTFDRKDEKDRDQRSAFWEWEKRVPGLMRNAAFEPAEKLLERTTAGTFGIEQHMQSWSLVDFLMAKHKPAAMQFLRTLKDPFHQRLKAPTSAELQARQLDALRQHLGWTPAELEAAWRDSVLGAKGRR